MLLTLCLNRNGQGCLNVWADKLPRNRTFVECVKAYYPAIIQTIEYGSVASIKVMPTARTKRNAFRLREPQVHQYALRVRLGSMLTYLTTRKQKGKQKNTH